MSGHIERRAAGERDQPDPVAAHLADQLGDLGLGAREPIRRGILGEHRARDVEHDDDVGRARAGAARSRSAGALRPHQRERSPHSSATHDQRRAGATRARRSALRGQPALHHRRQEARRAHRAPRSSSRRAGRDDRDREPTRGGRAGMDADPVEHHGSLRSTRAAQHAARAREHQRRGHEPRVVLVVLGEALLLDRGALQLVDLAVDAAQARRCRWRGSTGRRSCGDLARASPRRS